MTSSASVEPRSVAKDPGTAPPADCAVAVCTIAWFTQRNAAAVKHHVATPLIVGILVTDRIPVLAIREGAAAGAVDTPRNYEKYG